MERHVVNDLPDPGVVEPKATWHDYAIAAVGVLMAIALLTALAVGT